MLMLSSKLDGASVMSLQTGAKIAQITSAIIDPSSLDIVAYNISDRGLQSKEMLLLAEDIREVSDMGLIVDSIDELVEQEDMIKLKKLLELNFSLNDKVVIDEMKNKLGRVYDYSIDPMDFKIHQLYVKRPFIKSLGTSELIINRTQITEVNNKNIVVNSASLDERARPTTTHGEFVNPFRKAPSPSTGPNAIKNN